MLGTLSSPINSKWERVFDDFVAVDAQVMTEKEADVAGAAQAIHENATVGCLVVVYMLTIRRDFLQLVLGHSRIVIG